MNRARLLLLLAGVLTLAAVLAVAQRYRRDRSDRGGTPTWPLDPELPRDVFRFVRIQYPSGGDGRYWRGWGWDTDHPDAEMNLSFRLQQMTSMKVHPDGEIVELTDKELFDYPFIYIVEPGGMLLADEEVAALRRYLLNGGFLMVDDFWGEREWANFYREIRRVFPEQKYDPVELEMDHAIFHCVFPLKMTKNELQVPNFRTGEESQYTHITWERRDAREVHIKGIFDDKGRMMAIICHNTDNGDGWEREGEYQYYFREFSEKKAYPLMINILFYAMTH
ncbi:MAG: DUF4159 domain-containing protein [Verrucomicrobia bacterium]|nr:DUF4159 domain-containing protein [Verrucomicrobiota bacterium]